MRRMTVVRLVAVVGVLALVAAACGGTKKKTTTTGANKAATLAAAPGFDPAAKTIHLGVITPLTGPVAVIGNPLTAGTETWFKYVNSKGGIAGKFQVTLDKEDSQYKPDVSVQAYNKIKGNDVLIAQLLGTPPTKATLPLLQADNVVAAPASLDSDWVRQKNLLPVGGPYQIQMINAADYALKDLNGKGKTMCSMIQDDAYGHAGQAGVDFAAKEFGFAVKTTAKFTAPAADLTAQIQQLKTNSCEIVFLVATPSDTGTAMKTAAQLQFVPQWIGQSPTYAVALSKSALAPYLQAHFLLAGEGTEWGDTSVKGMKDMIDRVNQFAPGQQPDPYFTFGYYQAWAVTQVLEEAVKLGDLSRQGILNAMDKVGELTFDGLTGNYKYGPAATREPPRESTIFKIDPAKPGGLGKVKYNFTTDAASKFKFTG